MNNVYKCTIGSAIKLKFQVYSPRCLASATGLTDSQSAHTENNDMNASKSILLVISAALLGACASAPPKSVATPIPAKAVESVAVSTPLPTLPGPYTQKGVAIKIDGLWQSPDGTILGVSGTAKNVTATDLRFCQLSLAFLDEKGTQIADAKASTKSLKSAQIWHFQAGIEHPSSASYSAIQPDKTIAIPVKSPKAELASLK